MKLVDLVKAERVIESLSDKKLDINLSYKFMKFLKSIKDDVNFYDNKAKEIIEKYAERDENDNIVGEGTSIQLDAEKQAEMKKEIEELNNKEVDEPSIKFNMAELQGLQLSVVELLSLDKIINQED